MRTATSLGLVWLLCLTGRASTIDTVAGNGRAGYSGDGGPAVKARLNQPFHCDLNERTPADLLAGRGSLYVADALNHCIRRVDLKTGTITTVAGTGKKGYTGDGGPATRATFDEPYAVAVAGGTSRGDFYVVDRLNACVRKVDGKTGTIATVAGTGKKGFAGDGGPGNKAQLVEPNDCCLDGKGGLLIADVGDGRIRRLDLKTGTITTFAGIGRKKGKPAGKERGDGGPATRAILNGTRAVCVDGKGNAFVCEREGNAIRKVDGKGIITTLAGTGQTGYVDGPLDRARFRGPKAIRCDRQGNVYVVDTENHAIRKIDLETSRVITVVGGRKGSGGDGGDPLKASLNRPHGCIVDSANVIYVADSENHRVRRVRP